MKRSIKKVLIIRFGAIGDVVHTTALFRALKQSEPSMSIHYLTFKVPSILLLDDNDIEKIWILEDKTYKTLYELSKELRKENFDVIINLHPSTRSRILTLLSKPLQQLTYKKTYKLHAVENFWSTAKPIFKDLKLNDNIYIHVPDEIKFKTKSLIDNKKELLVGFNMGVSTTRHGRKWPFDYWVNLASYILEKYNAQIILLGGEKDMPEANEFVKQVPHVKSFCGKLSLLETAAAMSLCNTVISGDTGPLHIATAVGTRSIGIYGAAPDTRTGPYGKEHLVVKADMPCIPCSKKKCKFNKEKEDKAPCMYGIKPEKIMNLVDTVLG
jgi:ADP-heptose:LPS heptosyltransferase